MSKLGKLAVGSVIILFIGILILILGGMPFAVVDKGFVGVKTRFGKVVDGHLNPGLQFKTPFIESVFCINVQQDNVTEHSDAASKDLQRIDTDVKLLYSLEPTLVPTAYDRIGDRRSIDTKIITPAIKEVFKSVNANYTAEELITQRAKVSQQIEDDLNTFIHKSCTREGLEGLIRLDNVAIEDFRFSTQFDQSIENKQVAEQEALRAKEEKLKTITEAEGKKEQVRLASEAKALEIENEARAEALKIEAISMAKAAAIERESKALKNSPELIRLRQIEQWDGVMPRIMSGDGTGFLMQLKQD